jgi:hypothetical protein
MTKLQKTGRGAGETLRSVRTLKFGYDLSAMMQQGGFEAFGHPVAMAKRYKPMIEAFGSKEGQFAIERWIKNQPEYKSGELKGAGLELTDPNTHMLTKHEEIYAARLTRNIPGVKASERAFTTLLNLTRVERYLALKKTLGKIGGKNTPADLELFANFANVSTGRGNLGRFKQATGLLNAIFAAPRLRVSNFQLLLGQPILHKPFGKASLRARALIASEYIRTLSGMGLLLAAVSQIPGVDVELDPTSGNFLQIRMGNLHMDPLSRLKTPAVLLSRIGTGMIKTQKGKKLPISGDVPYGGQTIGGLALNYLRGGVTPVIAAIWNTLQGSTVTGEPTTAIKELVSAPLPLSTSGVRDALQSEGVPTKIAAALAAIHGVQTGYYEPQTSKQRKAERTRLQLRDEALRQGDFPRAFELSQRPAGGPEPEPSLADKIIKQQQREMKRLLNQMNRQPGGEE